MLSISLYCSVNESRKHALGTQTHMRTSAAIWGRAFAVCAANRNVIGLTYATCRRLRSVARHHRIHNTTEQWMSRCGTLPSPITSPSVWWGNCIVLAAYIDISSIRGNNKQFDALATSRPSHQGVHKVIRTRALAIVCTPPEATTVRAKFDVWFLFDMLLPVWYAVRSRKTYTFISFCV